MRARSGWLNPAFAALCATGGLLAVFDPASAQSVPSVLPDIVVNSHRAPAGETFVVERAELSPDGRRIAYVAALGNVRRLRVEALDGSASTTSDLAGIDLRDLTWAGNTHILLTLMRQSLTDTNVDNGIFSAMAFNVDRNAWETLLLNRTAGNELGVASMHAIGTRIPNQPRLLPIIFERPSVRTVDGRTEVFISTLSLDGSCRYGVYSIDLDTSATRRSDTGTTRTDAMVLHGNGELGALTQQGHLRIRDGVALRTVNLPRDVAIELIGPGRADGTYLIRLGAGEATQLVEVSGSRGEQRTIVDTGGMVDPLPLLDDQSGRLMGLIGHDREGHTAHLFFDTTLAIHWSDIKAAFPDDELTIASWSADLDKIIVYAEREDGADFHLVDFSSGVSRLLAPSYLPRGDFDLDRTGNTASIDIRRAAAARIVDPRILCRDARDPGE
ncbi:hypothetical protein [uncultured Brevundimonas sp.]|uniref:hypothetical protein n=1 Tax=uncultured Brevundimonas sp. TaxID=213418 RepID=UPI0030EB23C0|tara:strand:- start:3157 stop:4485 length:1329 start_codon:yes stop_codon:yes gene_type:complete